VAGLSSLVLGCGCAQNLNYLARPTHYLRGLQTVQTGCQFYHGVASGDPTPDGVILWTRVTVDGNFPEVSPSAADPGNVVVDVSWTVSLDEAAQQLVQSGTVQTDGEVDFTGTYL
jgi:alkaline phosphatase D